MIRYPVRLKTCGGFTLDEAESCNKIFSMNKKPPRLFRDAEVFYLGLFNFHFLIAAFFQSLHKLIFLCF